MNFIEVIELVQEQKKLNLCSVFIERKAWSNNTNKIVLITEDGICFMSKFDNTKCFISLEDLKADDWEVVWNE
jgi:hypothetical protein